MCGIVGKIHSDPEQVPDPDVLRRMMGAVAHRGPDGEGSWSHGPTALGFRRLAIIARADGGQPLLNETGRIALVFNGEIYNHHELRARLEALGHRFRGHSDGEVILHGYEQWGADVVLQLRGMFAFALVDTDAPRTVLGRDRLGKKPLFYAMVERGLPGEALIFASEIRALLADPALPRRVNPAAVDAYLTWLYVPDPETILDGVRQVPAGHILILEKGKTAIRRYWSLDYEPKAVVSPEEAVEQLRAQMDEAVRIRLESEAPLGFFLSAGLDSAAVATLARPHLTGRMQTFTAHVEGVRRDEREVARNLARVLGSEHHELLIRPDPAECLSLLPWHYGQPNGHPAACAYLYLYRWTAERVRVVISGDGGDEAFAGYERHRHLRRFDRWRRWPESLRRTALPRVALMSDRNPHSATLSRIRHRLGTSLLDDEALFVQSYINFFEWQRAQLLCPDFARAARAGGGRPEEAFERIVFAGNPLSLADRRLRAESLVMMPGFTFSKADKLGMAHALEVRSPLLDQELAGFAARLPAELKFRDGELKWILKQALAGTVPREILEGRKIGFGATPPEFLDRALATHARPMLLDATARSRGIVNPRMVESLVRQQLGGNPVHHHRLWSLMLLESWMRTYLDRPDPLTGPLDLSCP